MLNSHLHSQHVTAIFWRFIPFWIFLAFFKFGAALHYSLISPLGENFFDLWVVGLLMGGTALIQLLLDVPAGHLMDRYGYRRFLKISAFIFLLAALCFVFGLTKTTYILSLVLSIFGWLFFGPGVNAYILSHAPKQKAGQFISFRDVFGSIGVVFSSAALPLVLLYSSQSLGIILSILLGISLIAIILCPKDQSSAHLEKKIVNHHHYIKRNPLSSTIKAINKLNPASGMLLLTNMSGSIFYGIIWFVIPLVIVHQVNSGLLGLGLGIFDFAIVILGFFLGNLADKVNKRTLIFFGLILFSITGMFLGFNFTWIFLILGFLATAGDEMAGISLWSWMHSLDREHAEDGTVSGVINLFQDLGFAIGPMIAGLLYSYIGPSWTIFVGALPIFATWLIFEIMVNKSHLHLPNILPIPIKPHRARHRT